MCPYMYPVHTPAVCQEICHKLPFGIHYMCNLRLQTKLTWIYIFIASQNYPNIPRRNKALYVRLYLLPDSLQCDAACCTTIGIVCNSRLNASGVFLIVTHCLKTQQSASAKHYTVQQLRISICYIIDSILFQIFIVLFVFFQILMQG